MPGIVREMLLLGHTHPATLDSAHNLAALFSAVGKLNEALDVMLQ